MNPDEPGRILWAASVLAFTELKAVQQALPEYRRGACPVA